MRMEPYSIWNHLGQYHLFCAYHKTVCDGGYCHIFIVHPKCYEHLTNHKIRCTKSIQSHVWECTCASTCYRVYISQKLEKAACLSCHVSDLKHPWERWGYGVWTNNLTHRLLLFVSGGSLLRIMVRKQVTNSVNFSRWQMKPWSTCFLNGPSYKDFS